MARLVIVSNRVPNRDEQAGPRAGGLVAGLADVLAPGTLWFGWSGQRADVTSGAVREVEQAGITYGVMDLGDADYRAYYLGFANGTLWPLFHMMPALTRFEREEYTAYRAVNRAFAAALMPLLRPDDVIWVHDYQLLCVAQALRELGVTNRIGFFLHIPFPASSLFEILPPARELLAALTAHDLIGFQTESDREHFLHAIARLHVPGADLACRTVVTPAGIDPAGFAALAARASRRVEARRVVESLVGRALMIGVDRLDYTKGLPARFDAFGKFLARYPAHRRRISFLQVAAPSREEVDRYRALREELDNKVGAVNGAYSDFDWVPLRYMARTVSRGLVGGLYRIARIGLVTPLRDGMNLVAKEYVAAQDPTDPGVLILSRFAGAADSLTDALIVNPLDVDGMAEAIERALTMDLAERRARHAALLAAIEKTSAAAYCRNFLAALVAVGRVAPPPLRPASD